MFIKSFLFEGGDKPNRLTKGEMIKGGNEHGHI